MINADISRTCQIFRDNQKFTCIIEDEELLNLTGYKVLQNQQKNGFLKGVKTNYNGKIKLVYDVSGIDSLRSIVRGGNNKTVAIIIRNLMEILNKLKENGFMQCENVSLNMEDIFVDKNQYKIYVIYIPLKVVTKSNQILPFERELRKLILEVIEEYEKQENNCFSLFKQEIQDESVSWESLKEKLHQIDYMNEVKIESPQIEIDKKAKKKLFFSITRNPKKKVKKETQKKTKLPVNAKETAFFTSDMGGATELLEDCNEYCLIGGKNSEKIILRINSQEYLIGKSEEADGVIGFNKAISRAHCKIIQKGGKYFIEDLKSLNGTFLNGKKLAPNKIEIIREEDKIKLANCEFIFRKA